jgi:hypothetical protein
MTIQTSAARPVRRPLPLIDRETRGVRPAIGADIKLFGGWGVRF